MVPSGSLEPLPLTVHARSVQLDVNTAVGGAWPGNPDATTSFPQFHDIDYVRVYQRPAYSKQ